MKEPYMSVHKATPILFACALLLFYLLPFVPLSPPPAAAQGVILIAYLLIQGMKKRSLREQKVEHDYQAKLAEREGRDAVVVRAPAGSVTDGSTATNGSFPDGGHHTYATSVRPTGLQTV
jgi:hypothetical protein